MSLIDTSKDLISLFLQQVNATPDALALEDPNHQYTYSELEVKVTALAHRLRSFGIHEEKLVGILLPHTADFIISCLATNRAGGAYLVLEQAYPPDLLNDVVQDANPPVLITCQAEVKNIKAGVPLIVLDAPNTEINGHTEEVMLLPYEFDLDSLAFVSYSSGTTGLPKGIANHHRPGILSYDQRFAISDQKPGDRIACNTFFIWEMFRPLLRGASVFAVPDDASYDPVALVELLASKCITETLMTPTLLASILTNYSDPGALLPDLRVVWVTGEVVTTDLARRAMKAFPKTRLINSYSTSETWDTAMGDMKDVLKDVEQAMYCSVGSPLGVNKIYILDEDGNRLKPGNSGEISIGGPVLARGYLNLPEVTARTFIPDPFSSSPGARMYRSGDLGRILPSGSLEITGRIGAMIKLRGYSVVPAKVQIAIVTHLAVRDCALSSYGDGLDRQLVAYFVRDQQTRPDRPDVDVDMGGFSPSARRTLSPYLAAYMLPTYWIELTKLPANPVSGKIDTKRLPAPPIAKGSLSTNGHKHVSCDTDLDTIAQIWATTLEIPRDIITPEHNFFDLGGHSLSLANLSKRLATRFGFRIPVAQLVDPATLDGHLRTVRTFKDGQAVAVQADLPAKLQADCLLDPDIQPERIEMCSLRTADVVLLTGATGFLGGFLLYDLLQNSSAKVLCLMRASDAAAEEDLEATRARVRIRKSLLEKGLCVDTSMERIEVIMGNLAEENFGLSSPAHDRLASRVKIIFHAAATVNLVYPYAALRAANVGGTQEVLRLASLAGATVQYISTNSVLPPSTSGWAEDSHLKLEEVPEKLSNGYDQTKWVAEQLVIEAGHRGLPVRILRLGTIGGHSITGVSNTSDLFTALIVESIELGNAPEVDGWRAELTPVDFASSAIIHLSNQVETNQLIFHLGDPAPIETKTLFTYLGDLGYPTEPLEWEAWDALWTKNRSSLESDLISPVGVLQSGMPAVNFLTDTTILDNSLTKLYHQELTRPEMARSLLETYTQYWCARGWISKPSPGSQAVIKADS